MARAITAELWREISPYLDEALALSEAERAIWLEGLRKSRPQLAEIISSFLEDQRAVEQQRFLEDSPEQPIDEVFSKGQTVGVYRLISPIGHGGMGRVWLAERCDGRFERRVAVKFLQFSLATHAGVERFKREGRILGSLIHPHIAELIDAGVMADGQPYLVLEYVEGEIIDEYCDQRALPVQDRVRLFLDVLSALAHAHSNLIVHRDIKPSNVLVSKDGQVKLLDFGIAKLLADEPDSPAATAFTLQAGAALTPLFAAPEQVTAGPITTATDIYAAGLLVYKLLTGTHSAGSASRSTADLVKAIVDVEPPRPSDAVRASAGAEEAKKRGTTTDKLRRQLRGDLDTIVIKALKKSPSERYGSITAFAEDLRRYLKAEPISARPDTLGYRTRKFVRRNRLAVTLSTIAVAAMIAGLAGTLIQARTVRRQRDAALRERDRANRITQFMTDMFKVSDPTEVHAKDISAREILDKASTNIEDGLATDPVLQAQMMHVMGDVYRNLNIYPRAQTLLRRSLNLNLSKLGAASPETLSTMDDLAWVLGQEGELTAAERLQRQALATERATLGPDDAVTLQTMNDLGATLAYEGQVQNAEKLWRDTLDREKRVFGTEDHRTLSTMDNLAAALGGEGRFADAEQLQRENWALDSRALGPENLLTLGASDNLAETLVLMHRDDEAEQILRHNLTIVLRLVGPNHSETALIHYDLGRIAAHRGQRDQAFALIRQAVEGGLSPAMQQGIESDHELDSLHRDPRWRPLIAFVRKRLATLKK